jgi:predicted transcriptional regulator of viral defense system
MSSTITGLSQREAELLSRLAAANQAVFRYQDVLTYWPDSPATRIAISRLEKGGWIKRIERGLYLLVPLSAGPERTWSEDALVIATRLAEPAAVAYWTALRYWNLTEQLPRTVFVQSPQRKFKKQLTLAGVTYQMVTISASRFFGFVENSREGQLMRATDREKTILDAANRPEYAGGILQLAQALAVHWSELDWVRIDDYLIRFASGALYKRLGYIVETLGLPIPDRDERLAAWGQRLTAGIVDLDPSAGRGGTVRTRWRIRDNIDLVGGQEDMGR